MADAYDARDEDTTLSEAGGADAATADSERRRRALAAMAAVAIIVLVILLLLTRPGGQTTNVETGAVMAVPSAPASRTAPAAVVTTNVIVPDVVGQQEAAGRTRLDNTGLGSSTEWISAGEPEGTIIQQYPNAGVEVARGTVIELTISAGLGGSTSVGGPLVPSVLGMNAADARAKLRAKGWSYQVLRGPSTTTKAGVVFYQDPAAGSRAGTRRIKVWISDGTPTNGFPYARPEN